MRSLHKHEKSQNDRSEKISKSRAPKKNMEKITKQFFKQYPNALKELARK